MKNLKSYYRIATGSRLNCLVSFNAFKLPGKHMVSEEIKDFYEKYIFRKYYSLGFLKASVIYIKLDNITKDTLQGDRIENPDYILQNKLTPDYLHYITNQIMKPCLQLYSMVLEDLDGYKHKNDKNYWNGGTAEFGYINNDNVADIFVNFTIFFALFLNAFKRILN